jgi:hypothetical protein
MSGKVPLQPQICEAPGHPTIRWLSKQSPTSTPEQPALISRAPTLYCVAVYRTAGPHLRRFIANLGLIHVFFYILRSKYYICFLTPHVSDFPRAGAAEDQPFARCCRGPAFAPWTVKSSAHTLNLSYVREVRSISRLWRAFGGNTREGKPHIYYGVE